MSHGNSGFRVKHLNYTSGCEHYKNCEIDGEVLDLSSSNYCPVKCSTNKCNNRATRACHVIMANQSAATGSRYIVYCCAVCNGNKNGEICDIRGNAECYMMGDCDCGTD
jgi:hypothetical protein